MCLMVCLKVQMIWIKEGEERAEKGGNRLETAQHSPSDTLNFSWVLLLHTDCTGGHKQSFLRPDLTYDRQ